MYVRVWRFRPKPGLDQQFLEAYGPQGTWARLFATAPGFLGTELLLAEGAQPFYLTCDRWVNQASWRSFLDASRSAYEKLDHDTEALVAEEFEIGEFHPLPDHT